MYGLQTQFAATSVSKSWRQVGRRAFFRNLFEQSGAIKHPVQLFGVGRILIMSFLIMSYGYHMEVLNCHVSSSHPGHGFRAACCLVHRTPVCMLCRILLARTVQTFEPLAVLVVSERQSVMSVMDARLHLSFRLCRVQKACLTSWSNVS